MAMFFKYSTDSMNVFSSVDENKMWAHVFAAELLLSSLRCNTNTSLGDDSLKKVLLLSFTHYLPLDARLRLSTVNICLFYSFSVYSRKHKAAFKDSHSSLRRRSCTTVMMHDLFSSSMMYDEQKFAK